MKKIILATMAMVLSIAVFSQQSTIKWGKPFSKTAIGVSIEVLKNDSKGLVLLSQIPIPFQSASQIGIIKCDQNLNYISTVKYPLKDGKEGLSYEFTVTMKDRTLIFASRNEGSSLKKILYYYEYNRENNTLSSTPVKILEMPVVKKPMVISGTYFYDMSPDSSQLAILYNPPTGPEGQEKFGVAIFNSKMELLSKRLDPLPFKDKNFTLSYTAMSANGNIFLCGTLITGVKKPFVKEPNYKYTILMYPAGEGKVKEIDIERNGVFINDLRLGTNNSGDIFAIGFFSDNMKYTMKGAMSIMIDPESGEIIKRDQKDFPLDLITEGLSEKQAEKTQERAEKGKNIEIANYDLDYMLPRPGDGVYLVAERYWVEEHTTYSNGHSSTTYTYHANNIMIVGANDQGEIDLMRMIPKKQKASNSGYVGYVCNIFGDDLYFYFTDNAINNAPNPPEATQYAYYKGPKGVTTEVRLSSAGEIVRKTFYTIDKNNFMILPAQAQRMGKGDILLVSGGMAKIKFGIIHHQ